MGSISFVWGIFVILADSGSANGTTGYIMLGLGLVCYSISSKVILLAKIWRREFKLANRIPMIPVLTALTCLFLAAFVFELATVNTDYFIPARVLVGLGAICFTLFSIVSILESGTSRKGFKKHSFYWVLNQSPPWFKRKASLVLNQRGLGLKPNSLLLLLQPHFIYIISTILQIAHTTVSMECIQ